MVAHLEPELYRQFYAIAKEQASDVAFNKWDDYELVLDKNIINKIKNFVPVNEYGKSNKGFRITKNGKSTGIFYKKNEQNYEINENIELELDPNANKSLVPNVSRINIIPTRNINSNSIIKMKMKINQ